MKMKAVFQISGLSKSYEKKRVLDDINLAINQGEIFCILGPSGAGKTTLLRLLNCLDKPDGGRIYFNGTNLMKAGGVELLNLRRKMALVFQEGTVFNASVYDNVAYGLKVRGVHEEEIRKRVKKALEVVGLRGYSERNARTLSGGEKQRVTFAMAAVLEPEVLLLDEPTANLDPINIEIIKDIIMQIKNLGITVIIATHKQDEAIELADRIAVLNYGRIEQIGTPDEIFRKPATEFVARFTETKNIFHGEVKFVDSGNKRIKIATKHFDIEPPYKALKEGSKVKVCIRPEEIMILREDVPINLKHKNVLWGTITKKFPHGSSMFRLNVKLINTDCNLVIDIPRHVAEIMDLEKDKNITMSLKTSACHVID